MDYQEIKESVLEIITKHGNFVLSSGMQTTIFYDCSNLIYKPYLMDYIVDYFPRELFEFVDGIVAPAVTGIPFGLLLARKHNKYFLIARPKEKEIFKDGFKIIDGDRYIIFDDVITTGNTVLKIKKEIENKGGIVDKVLTVVYRDGKKESLDRVNVKCFLDMS